MWLTSCFLLKSNHIEKQLISYHISGACPGGGAQGAWAPPPLEIEKQKKKKKGHQSKY